jgi:hypothetical protein
MTIKEHSPLSTLLHLRLTVGFLGERAQFAWWPTAFYESSSRLFLEPAFPKTLRLAQYHGVVEAARLLHDEHLSVGSYHLFRLPEEVEEDLHALLLGTADDDLSIGASQSKETAIAALKRAAHVPALKSEGPTKVGSISDLGAPSIQKVAEHYLTAFSNNIKTYPYFVS